jgi:hypothetical protein
VSEKDALVGNTSQQDKERSHMGATPEERALHQRLLEEDPTAPAALAEQLFVNVRNEVRARVRSEAAKANRVSDESLADESAADAILIYAQDPSEYDPERSPLLRYLVMAAYRDYQNAIAKEERRRRHLKSLTEYEVLAEDEIDDAQDLDQIAGRLDAQSLRERILSRFHDELERRLVSLILDNTATAEECALVLGIQYISPEDQRREVQRTKDRITKRLRRRGETLK